MHVDLIGGKRRLSLGAMESRPSIWVAYRELITPRLGCSAGSGKRRRREEREAIVIDPVGQWPWSAEPLCGSVPQKSISNRLLRHWDSSKTYIIIARLHESLTIPRTSHLNLETER